MPEPYDTITLALEATIFVAVFLFRVVLKWLSQRAMLGLLAVASVLATVRGIINGHFGWGFFLGLAAAVLIVVWWTERNPVSTDEQARQ
ncbi:hypothetical protein ACIRQH_19915 [Streptomyces sp. NPDC102279]|uniref:hypothetical protein n=1 Tax=Streptomyces sp. NPDC102279 TaxID=3366153 RepID=UPI00380E471B